MENILQVKKELTQLRNSLDNILQRLGSNNGEAPVRRMKTKSVRKDKYRSQIKRTA